MNRALAAVLSVLVAAPAAAAVSRDELKKALDANPDLVIGALKKADKGALFELMMEAQRDYQAKKQKEEEEKEKAELEAAYKNPFKPVIDEKTRVRGDKNAPITLVEYSDFQCPYCGRGFQVVEAVRQKYGAKVRFVYKHLPLVAIHPFALPAAKWQEAVALQSPDKAWVFHDKMFENQGQLGEDFFKKTVKELGLDVAKAAKDAESKVVADKIEADVKEAKSFGFTGTPGFLINGVPLRGAYPPEDFDKIINRLGV
ncbi:MAG: thioredoxin domain-containing protein [Elusimicrobia bacterium]|nr:thioredoxin domain-containing protein [Elusimicrobiota bacterium]